MAVYWLTFRIADRVVSGQNYDRRYQNLLDEVKARSPKWWEDTTSFIIFRSDNTISELAAAFEQQISTSYDLFVIREMDSKDARICGDNNDEDIFELMPYLKYA